MKGLVGKVVIQRNAAVGALVDESAIAAEGEGGKTTPVQKEESLLSPFGILLQGFFQSPGKNQTFFPFSLFLAHVHHLNFRQRAVVDTMGKSEIPEFFF